MANKRGVREKPYNIKPVEPRGMVGKEIQPVKAFWKTHTMDEAITWTPEELDAKLELHYDDYEARQLKADPNWEYRDIKPKGWLT